MKRFFADENENKPVEKESNYDDNYETGKIFLSHGCIELLLPINYY